MSEGLLGIIVGGALTLVGQFLAELWRGRIAVKGLQAERNATARQSREENLKSCRKAASALKSTLIEYAHVDLPTPDLERKLREDVSDFQAHMYSAPGKKVVGALEAWYTTGLKWANGDGLAAREDDAWVKAMKALGEEVNRQY